MWTGGTGCCRTCGVSAWQTCHSHESSELGTGWIHFYSLYLRLFFDFRGTLYDVWDNRQLHALKRIFSQLGAMQARRRRAPTSPDLR